MSVFLVGGGPDLLDAGLLEPFRAEVAARAPGRTRGVVAALFDVDGSADYYLPAYADLLVGVPLLLVRLGPGHRVDPAVFAAAEGIVVGGGPTPDYHAALVDSAGSIRAAVVAGVPYLGFSAGAMIASETALIGGYERDGREVCPQEWSEGLDDLTLRPGLGLVPFTVDVHTAQAGTLGRTVSAVRSGGVASAVGIDEGTCVRVTADGGFLVSGAGHAWVIEAGGTIEVLAGE